MCHLAAVLLMFILEAISLSLWNLRFPSPFLFLSLTTPRSISPRPPTRPVARHRRAALTMNRHRPCACVRPSHWDFLCRIHYGFEPILG